MEPLRWIENGVGRRSDGGLGTDELLDAYQRGVLTAGEDTSAEEEDKSYPEAPKDFDQTKAAADGAEATEWADRARTAVPVGARVVLGDIKAGNGYVHVVDAARQEFAQRHQGTDASRVMKLIRRGRLQWKSHRAGHKGASGKARR